jgi:hypothetical protein
MATAVWLPAVFPLPQPPLRETEAGDGEDQVRVPVNISEKFFPCKNGDFSEKSALILPEKIPYLG